MLLKWLNAGKAIEVGSALADQFLPQTGPGPSKRPKKARPGEHAEELQKFVQRIDREASPLQLNIYKRAKLANSFRWKLLENGVEPQLVEELTRILVLRISGKKS
jgi:hypothetical protein